MAWENVIIGYVPKSFKMNDVIPVDAKFMCIDKEFTGMIGWASNPHPNYETVFWYQVPIYKKKNIKKKQ